MRNPESQKNSPARKLAAGRQPAAEAPERKRTGAGTAGEKRPAGKRIAGKRSGEKRPGARRPWQRVLTLLFLLVFLLFLLPVYAGILNVANLAAMAAALVLAAAVWWWPLTRRVLAWFWARTWGRVLLLVSGVGVTALALVILVLCFQVMGDLGAQPETDCPTLIVLGCQVRGQTPSLLLSYRIQAAADYLAAHPQSVAILSGGKGEGEDISEAECMYRSLTARGVDPGRLYREEQSTVTQENLTFSAALMEREGLTGPVAIVSNGFHVHRALVMAEDLNLPAQGLAARQNWYSLPTYVLREALGLVYYYFH